ncbi:MAG: succinate dehydrogenase cytochrome b subunit [Gemmatimonadota bacterium]|nr:succinate dehydrogenase cytochrome b subunit [Gemmatimonadota bacterium]
MRRVATLYRSTVGKKVLMAVSGVVLFGFVFMHMVGNLKMLFPVDGAGHYPMNVYAEYLREFGYPLLPHAGFLWLFRLVLLAAVVVHIVAAVQLSQRSRAARPKAYGKNQDLSLSYASRTMRWGGVILLLFIVYHILHFTTGQAHPEFVAGAVHQNYVSAFQSPLIFGVYLVAQAALGFHLYHGVWSFFQTLGLNHPKYNHMRRRFAAAFAVVVFVGFLTPPTLVLAGVIS